VVVELVENGAANAPGPGRARARSAQVTKELSAPRSRDQEPVGASAVPRNCSKWEVESRALQRVHAGHHRRGHLSGTGRPSAGGLIVTPCVSESYPTRSQRVRALIHRFPPACGIRTRLRQPAISGVSRWTAQLIQAVLKHRHNPAQALADHARRCADHPAHAGVRQVTLGKQLLSSGTGLAYPKTTARVCPDPFEIASLPAGVGRDGGALLTLGADVRAATSLARSNAKANRDARCSRSSFRCPDPAHRAVDRGPGQTDGVAENQQSGRE